MKCKLQILAVGFISILLVGCAGGLNSMQKSELRSFSAKGLLVTEKNQAQVPLSAFYPVVVLFTHVSTVWV